MLVITPRPALAQTSKPTSEGTVHIVPGARYDAGRFHRFLMGDGYRDLWTMGIEVPVLDLASYAGGLTPLRSHVGSQTTSLRLRGADGRLYQFRSADKNPTANLEEELRTTVAGRLLQDVVSSTHPVGGVVAADLLETAGVLHVTPELFVAPHSPALGEFREQFAGLLGTLEERPDENAGGDAAFGGARKVSGADKLFERINKSPQHRVDERAFLRARLVDLFLGDRDRHRDNWRWASFEKGNPTIWQPVSRDHDHAFERLGGLVPLLASAYHPGIINFRGEYDEIVRLTWNGQEVDRRFLSGLEWAVWDSVAHDLQARFTDEALVHAMRKMPDAYQEAAGDDLVRTLKARRDGLLDEARHFYEFLAEEVAIHATNADEEATVTLPGDGTVTITVRERKKHRRPVLSRTFLPDETREVRLRMFGGDDRVLVEGPGDSSIKIRILGGGGKDTLVDNADAARLRFYDDPAGPSRTEGRPHRVNRRPYTEWVGSDLDRYPPREWGREWIPLPWVSYDTDYGAFIGGGISRVRYGFRKEPYATRTVLKAGLTTDPRAVRVAFETERRLENSGVFASLGALASGVEILHFYGLGNDTDRAGRGTDFFRVKQVQYRLGVDLSLPLGSNLRVLVGPRFQYADTGDNSGRFVEQIEGSLYGAGDFGQIGAGAGIEWDRRNRPRSASSGYVLQADAELYPAVWDVTSTFGAIDVRSAAFLPLPLAADPVLAFRAGGRKVWGTFPFHEAAYIGGRRTLRGWSRERFAGDASLYGSAELRLFVTPFFLVLPGDFGLFGLVDTGRVYLDGESPGGWHTGVGGGIWFSFLNRANSFSLGVARGREKTGVYLSGGFAF